MDSTITDSANEIAIASVVSLFQIYRAGTAFEQAACRSVNTALARKVTSIRERTDLFYDSQHADLARGICQRCPAMSDCLLTSLLYEITIPARAANPTELLFGIWGGTTPSERAIMLKQLTLGQLLNMALHTQLGTLYDASSRLLEGLENDCPAALTVSLHSIRPQLRKALTTEMPLS